MVRSGGKVVLLLLGPRLAHPQELPFCGHGTMGAANVLFTLHSEASVIRFSAKPGEIIAKRQAEGVELSLPVIPLDNETQNADDLVTHIVQVSTITPGDVVDLVTFTWSGLGVVVELKPEFDLARASIDGRGLVGCLQATPLPSLTPRRTREPGW